MPIRPIKPKIKNAYGKAKAKVRAGAGSLKRTLQRRFFGTRVGMRELEANKLSRPEVNHKIGKATTVAGLSRGGRVEKLKEMTETVKPDEKLIKSRVVDITAAMKPKKVEVSQRPGIGAGNGAKKPAKKKTETEEKVA